MVTVLVPISNRVFLIQNVYKHTSVQAYIQYKRTYVYVPASIPCRYSRHDLPM